MKKKVSPKQCPHCGINMRATYIQQSLKRDEKRKSSWIRVGQICLHCSTFISELKETEK